VLRRPTLECSTIASVVTRSVALAPFAAAYSSFAASSLWIGNE